jgi:diguanylate cyclase (GGDEF)-like protein
MCGDGVFLARWSGAEFVVLLPDLGLREGVVLADEIRAAVSSADWPGGESQPKGRLTMSAGVAALPGNATNLDGLIEAAAEALSEARWNGDTTLSAAAKPVFGEAATQEITVSMTATSRSGSGSDSTP